MTNDLQPGVEHIRRLLAAAGRSAHYDVVSLVGAGGIGAVYKAIDTRLKRPVAIKAVHAAHLLEARGAARLRTEALAAASLDHPYICKIYELIDTGSEPLIVMEFVEGETFAAVLSRGVPPIQTTLGIAIEIAEGLAAAHGHGLVHRDVKPANVVITPHGHVKLLDFGLALPDSTSADGAETRLAEPASDLHAGTPRYMSPEQAAGRPVTAKSDVFSLGVLLFEATTGTLPFRGASVFEYIRHLQSSPAARLERLAPGVPVDFARTVESCLEKSPGDRPDSRVLVAELRDVLSRLTAMADGPQTVGAARRRARRRLAAASLFSAGGLALAYYWFASPVPAPAAVWTSRPLASSSASESESRISPDGQWVSFLASDAGTTDLMVQRLDGGEAKKVELPAGAILGHVWSPDGSRIACVLRQDGTERLVIVPAFFGGPSTVQLPLSRAATSVRLLRWIDTRIYYEVRDNSGRTLWRTDPAAGVPQPLSRDWKLPGTLGGFDVSPDEQRVVFSLNTSGQEDLWTARLDGTGLNRVTDTTFFERSPLWSRNGTSVVYQSNRGGQVDIWETDLASGASSPLTSSPTSETPNSTSADGHIVSLQQVSDASHLWEIGPNGERQITDDVLADASPSVARSGDQLVFQRRRPTSQEGNAVTDSRLFVTRWPAGTAVKPRTFADGFAPIVSPEGRYVAYYQTRPGTSLAALFVRDLQNDRTVAVSSAALPPSNTVFPNDWVEPTAAWSRDAALFFIEGPGPWTLRRYEAGAEAPDGRPVAATAPGQRFRSVAVTSDGRQLALVATGSSGSRLLVFGRGTGTHREVDLGADRPFIRGWAMDGREVVLVRPLAIQADGASRLEIVLADEQGGTRVANHVEGAFFSTVRVDPVRSLLYATLQESGVHNIAAVPLLGGPVRRITANGRRGVTYGGVEALPNGGWLAVRAERRADIWILEEPPR